MSHDPNGVTWLAGFRHPTKLWSNCCCEFIESKLLTLFTSDRVCWGRCHCCHQELHDSQQEHTLGRHLKNDITIEVKPDEFLQNSHIYYKNYMDRFTASIAEAGVFRIMVFILDDLVCIFNLIAPKMEKHGAIKPFLEIHKKSNYIYIYVYMQIFTNDAMCYITLYCEIVSAMIQVIAWWLTGNKTFI